MRRRALLGGIGVLVLAAGWGGALLVARRAKEAPPAEARRAQGAPRPRKRVLGVREPAVAGMWYPASKEALLKAVEGYLAGGEKPKVKGKLLALISPHAGYEFCGTVMGKAYAALKGESFSTVVVVGPSHHAPIRVSVGEFDAYRTPLGLVPVNKEACQLLRSKSPVISFIPDAHRPEHCIESQLPFLQVVLGKFKLVPVLVGPYGDRYWRRLGELLAEVARRWNALLVASSDMSHYPLDGRTARKVDKRTISAILSLSPEAVKRLSDELVGKVPGLDCILCGLGPVMAVMHAAKLLGADKAVLLGYSNSAEVEPNAPRVVGYGAVAFYATKGVKSPPPKGKEVGRMPLSHEERVELLKLARRTLEEYLTKGTIPEYRPKSKRMEEPRAVFVTLKEHGRLRGCIGQIEAVEPLYLAVQHMAIEAATHDPRFPPVEPRELKDVEIEISILTPFERVRDVKEIVVGKHGLYIRKGFYSGLLLPQVPVEWGWDRDEFLRQVCYKAGLPPDAWKDPDANLFKFEAEVFSEESEGLTGGGRR